MHTGIVSPRSAMVRQCAAPTLWRCQCIARVRGPRTCTRYIPTLRMPRTGSREITIGSVMYGPPSPGQQVRIGKRRRSTSSPRVTISCDGAPGPRTRGGNLATSSNRGRSASLATSPSGTLSSINSVIRPPIASRSSAPNAIAMRRIEPNRLMATGYRDRVPSSSRTCSNRTARPPPGCFITRSLIAASSSLADTGSVTRVSSPARSSASMKSPNRSNTG